jgi:hypothetical protein
MLPAILTILSVQTQESPLRFQPKVGEKYRFQATVDEVSGAIGIPADMNLFLTFKVAGIKDGKFTVHQLFEYSAKAAKSPTSDPILKATFQIDELLKAKTLANPSAGANADVAAAIGDAIGSVFLINFPKDFPVVGKEVVDKLDLTKFVQSMFASIPPEELFLHTELDGTRKTTLKAFDARTATFDSSLSIKIKVTPPEGAGADSGGMTVDASGTVVIERSTGFPSDYVMKMKIVVSEGSKSETMNVGMHLFRKI